MIKHIKWAYIFKLTSFATAIIILAVIFVVGGLSWQYVAYLTVWDCPQPACTPADVGLANYQTVLLKPQTDQMLTAWYIPSENGAAILLLQGHWAARDGMLTDAVLLSQHGYGVMLLDPHPCVGPNVPHTMGYHEVTDVAAAVKFLRQQSDVVDGKIGVLGFSMGGVIAIESAARVPEIQAVVAQGNFHDLTFKPRGNEDTLIGSGVQWIMVRSYQYYTGLDPDLVKPIEAVTKISPRPILFIAGEDESGANQTQAQFDAADQPKALWVVPDVGHGGYRQRWPEEYEDRVIGFFANAFF